MAQVGLVMRLFAGEFLLIATSDATSQSQSFQRAWNGILGFNHLLFLPLCFPVSGLTPVSACCHWPPKCPRLEPGSHCRVFPFLTSPHPPHQQTTSRHFFPCSLSHPSPSCPHLLPRLLQQSLHVCSWPPAVHSLQVNHSNLCSGEPATEGLCSKPCCPSDSPPQHQLCWLFPPSICSPVFPGPASSHLALRSPSKVGLHPQYTQQPLFSFSPHLFLS